MAIIIVLLYHLGINRLLRLFDWWVVGRLGVDIFFVLSGFLITTLLLKEQISHGHVSLKKFYIRRFLRIVPVAYLFLLALIVINYFFNCDLNFKSVICSVLYIKNLPIHGINDRWTDHFWSLSVEEQFYLFFPVLLITHINKTTVFAVSTVLLILVFSLSDFRVARFLFWEGPFTVLIGCIFSVLAFKGIINVERLKNKYFLSCTLFLIAIIIHSPTFSLYVPYFSEFLFDVLIGFVILMSLNADNLFNRILNSGFLIWMGALSYSLYIWQQIFIWIPSPLTGTHLWGLSSNSLFLIADACRLLGILCAACLSYYFFEQKFLKLKTHFI